MLEAAYGVNLSRVRFLLIPEPRLPAPFLRVYLNLLGVLLSDYARNKISQETKKHDIFINYEMRFDIPPAAKKNLMFIHFPLLTALAPEVRRGSILGRFYSFPYNQIVSRMGLDDYKRRFYADLYDRFYCNSEYTKYWTWKRLSVKPEVIYPPIDRMLDTTVARRNRILTVARFDPRKRQLELVEAFKEMCRAGLNNWEYHLVGDVFDREYFDNVRAEATGYPILFHVKASSIELSKVYSGSKIFWHATGYQSQNPDDKEHFGIVVGEAMSAGCVPVVFDGGGHREIVRDKVDGFLWPTLEELKRQTNLLIDNEDLRETMKKSSIERSRIFNRKTFEGKITTIVAEVAKEF